MGLKRRKIEDIQEESLRMEVNITMVPGIEPRKNAGGDAWSSTTIHRDSVLPATLFDGLTQDFKQFV